MGSHLGCGDPPCFSVFRSLQWLLSVCPLLLGFLCVCVWSFFIFECLRRLFTVMASCINTYRTLYKSQVYCLMDFHKLTVQVKKQNIISPWRVSALSPSTLSSKGDVFLDCQRDSFVYFTFKLHTYRIIQNVFFFMTGFICSLCLWDPSMFLHIVVFIFILEQCVHILNLCTYLHWVCTEE